MHLAHGSYIRSDMAENGIRGPPATAERSNAVGGIRPGRCVCGRTPELTGCGRKPIPGVRFPEQGGQRFCRRAVPTGVLAGNDPGGPAPEAGRRGATRNGPDPFRFLRAARQRGSGSRRCATRERSRRRLTLWDCASGGTERRSAGGGSPLPDPSQEDVQAFDGPVRASNKLRLSIRTRPNSRIF